MRVSNIEILKRELLDSDSCRQQILEMLTEIAIDAMQVFDFGARKHPDSGNTPNFLTPAGQKCEIKVRGSGVLRHAAQCFGKVDAVDDESKLPHILHLIASAAILYIRHKRNIVHPADESK